MRAQLAQAPRTSVFAYLLFVALFIGCGEHKNAAGTRDPHSDNLATAEGARDATGVNPGPGPISKATGSSDASAAHFVGTQVCMECHADHCESFTHTAHRQSLSETVAADEPPDAEFEHAAT